MKLLVLNYEFPPIGGGASPVSFDISRGYVRHGHDVHVVTMRFRNLPAYEVIEGMHIHRVRCIRMEKFVCHPWEQLSYIISAIIFLRQFLKKNRIDFIHTHFIIPTGAIAWYLRKTRNLPYIITAHGSDTPGHNNKRFGLLYKLLMRPWRTIVNAADYVVTPSGYLKDLICSNMNSNVSDPFDRDKIKIIPNGINTDKYYIGIKEKTILIMGRLQETKGVQDILKSIDLGLLGDWKILIAGEGPYKNALNTIVIDKGLQDSVRFLGWVDSENGQKYTLLAGSAIFISGSYFENCPVTLIEAYCSGCKLVVSDIPGHKEIASDKAIYFTPGDLNDIRNALKKAMSNYSESVEPDQVITDLFDWDKKITSYEELMKNGEKDPRYNRY